MEETTFGRALSQYCTASSIAQMFYTYERYSTEGDTFRLSDGYEELTYPTFTTLIKKMLFNKTLKGMDFRYARIPNSSFYGSDLSGSDFFSAYIYGCDFTECVLNDCNWVNAHVGHAGVLLRGAHLEGSTFGRVSLNHNTCMDDCTLGQSSILDGEFHGTSMMSVTMIDMSIHSTRFIGTRMEASSISGTRIDKCIFVPSSGRIVVESYGIDGLNDTVGHNDPAGIQYNDVTIDLRGLRFDGNSHAPPKTVDSMIFPYDSREYELVHGRKQFMVEFKEMDDIDEPETKALIHISYDGTGTDRDRRVMYGKIEGSPKESRCSLEGTLFTDTTLTNSRLFNCNMRNVDFNSSSLFGTHAVCTDFGQTHFRTLDMANTISFRGVYAECSFRDCIFDSSDISNTDFFDCDFKGARFNASRLDDVCMVFREQRVESPENVSSHGAIRDYLVFRGCKMKNLLIDIEIEGSRRWELRFVDCDIRDSRIKLGSYEFKLDGGSFSRII